MSKGEEVAHSWGVRKEEAGYCNIKCGGCKLAACRSLHPWVFSSFPSFLSFSSHWLSYFWDPWHQHFQTL